MNSDITKFYTLNVIDSCSVWNILSIPIVYNASLIAGCFYSFTNYVHYECLKKTGSKPRNANLCSELKREIAKNNFKVCDITIEDLQEMEILEARKKLGKGELSSIVFAKKTNQVFLTDDKKARNLAKEVLGKDRVQTTPHLVGYCFFQRILLDGDYPSIIADHKASLTSNWGDLEIYFKEAYEESLKIKLMIGQ